MMLNEKSVCKNQRKDLEGCVEGSHAVGLERVTLRKERRAEDVEVHFGG